MSAPTLTQEDHPTTQAPETPDTASGPAPQPNAPGTGLTWIRTGLHNSGRALWRAGAILLFLLLWELGPLYLAPASTQVFLPPLHDVLGALGALIAKGQLQNHLAASLSRSASGFGIAVVSAVVLGLLVAWYVALDRFLNPLLECRSTVLRALGLTEAILFRRRRRRRRSRPSQGKDQGRGPDGSGRPTGSHSTGHQLHPTPGHA